MALQLWQRRSISSARVWTSHDNKFSGHRFSGQYSVADREKGNKDWPGSQMGLQEPAVRVSNCDGHAGKTTTGAARRKDKFLCPSVAVLLLFRHANHHDHARHRSSPDELLLPRSRILLFSSTPCLPCRSRLDTR